MKFLFIISLAITLSATKLSASDYSDILLSIKQNNTELKAYQAQIDAQESNIKTNNNLSNPSVEGAYLVGHGQIGNKWEVGVSQGFDWPGLYAARSKENKARINALKASYQKKHLEIMLRANNLCLEIINLNKKIAFDQNILSTLDSLHQKSMKGLEYGEISILDTNKLKIERIGVSQAINDCKSLLDVKIKELEGLNGNQPLSNVDLLSAYPAQSLKTVDEYMQEMRAIDPQVSIHSHEIEANTKAISTSKMDGLPKFNIGYRHVNELGEHFNGVGLGVSLPIFENRGKNKAAKAEALASELALSDALNTHSAEIVSLHNRATSLSKQISAYSEAINGCNNVDILGKALNGGQITLLNYLMELRYFIDAQKMLIDLEYEYNAAVTNLNKYQLM